MKNLLTFVSVAILLTALFPVSGRSVVHQYVEDFTTKQYCDVVATTADWDTLAGELKLFPFEPSIVGNHPAPVVDVAVSGNYAYTIRPTNGLNVMDISDPTGPTLIGNYLGMGNAYRVVVTGDLAFMTDVDQGLLVVDVSDPTNPGLLGSTNPSGTSADLAVSGDYVYMCDPDVGFGRLHIVDVIDPTNPIVRTGVILPMPTEDVAIAGDHLFVTQDADGILIADITNPTSLNVLAWLSTGSTARALAVAGDNLYVGGSSGLDVVDVSDPANPSIHGSVMTPGDVWDIVLSGNHAYLAVEGAGFFVVDITDPSNPAIEDNISTGTEAYGVDVAGEHVFVADDGLWVIRTSHAVTQEPWSVAQLSPYETAHGVAVDGDYAYLAEWDALEIVDISDPTAPSSVASTISWTSSFNDVCVAGDYAFLSGSGIHGFSVFDVSDPASPVWRTGWSMTGESHGLDVEGNYAYVADNVAGLHVFDITDPELPTPYGPFALPGIVNAVAVEGNYAFVACGPSGLLTLDITDPTTPLTAGISGGGTSCRDVAVSGNYAYVADLVDGLLVFDVSDPASPWLAASYAGLAGLGTVAVSGDYAFTTATTTPGVRFYTFDISDPMSPSPVASSVAPAGSPCTGVAVDGKHAFLACIYEGLRVFQVFQDGWDADANVGASLDIEPLGQPVTWVSFDAAHSPEILWQLSTNGGGSWLEVTPDGTWYQLGVSGEELLWRSTHYPISEDDNPTCTGLEINWLYDFPVIDEIVDVGNDQGRQVSITWTRSGRDRVGSSTPITEYAIYRRIDELSARGDVLHDRAGAALRADPPGGEPLYPPGDWHFVSTVPARAEDEYATVVPTLKDSTISEGMHYSIFFVSALTEVPGVYFDSPPDSGYSVDNLAPFVPTGFAVDHNATVNYLSWDESPDEDFQYFRIYRSTNPELIHSPENLIHSTIDIEWVDEVTEGWLYYYVITAVDFSGNESGPAYPETLTDVGDDTVPRRFALHQCSPNPMKQSTTIRFDVPDGAADVTLDIFDAGGRLVREFVDTSDAPGRRSVVWDGKDRSGQSVASGVYYYRLRAEGFERTLKMTVLR